VSHAYLHREPSQICPSFSFVASAVARAANRGGARVVQDAAARAPLSQILAALPDGRTT